MAKVKMQELNFQELNFKATNYMRTRSISTCLQTASLLCALFSPLLASASDLQPATLYNSHNPHNLQTGLYDQLTHGQFYVSGRVGFVGGESVKHGNEVGDPVTRYFQDIQHYQRGRSGGLALGYSAGRVRVELAGNYSENRLESVDSGATLDMSVVNNDELAPGAHIINVSGHSELADILVNFYFDFKNSSRFTPFIGFGLGAVYNKQNSFVDLPAAISDLKRREILDEDWVFAYQGKAGFNYRVNSNVLFGLEVRCLVFDSSYFSGKEFFVTMPDFPLSLKQNQKASHLNRSLRFGVTYLFSSV